MNYEPIEADEAIEQASIFPEPTKKDTLGWLLSVLFKFGAGYLMRMVLDAFEL